MAPRPSEEARFQELVEGLDAIVAEYDAKGCRFTYVSRRAEQLLGYPVERWLQGGFWESILHPEDREQAVQLCAQFTAQAVDHEIEYRVVSLDGRAVWLRESARVLRDMHGRAERLFILLTDETARKRAEALLGAQRRILEQVARGESLDTIFQAILHVAATLLPRAPCILSLGEPGAEGQRVASVNLDEAAARMLAAAAPLAAVDGTGLVVVESLAHLPGERAAWEPAARHGGRAYWSMPITTSARHRRGRLDVFFPDARAPRPEERQCLEVLAQLTSVALERMEAHEALLQRTEALVEADRRKDEFMAMLGHELRNPLAPILTAVKLLPTADDARRARMCQVLERQTKHMARLLDDLLEVSRITRGKVQVCPEPLVLQDVLQRAVEGVRPLIDQQGHRLAVEPGSQGLPLQGDPTRLEQVFMNLLNNAAKFTPPGGDIVVTVSEEAGRAVVSVRDTGVGIPAELLPHVFEPFRQGEQTLSRQQGGLGIGLTLVRELVKLHGGSVVARSDGPGRGSEFRVYLPVAATAEPPALKGAAEEPRPPRAAHPRRVLVVDDNVDAAGTLSELLAARGHAVSLAHDGHGALEQALALRPEAVILDLGLPGLDGFEVAQRLRDDPRTSGATLVALTGYGQDRDRERARAAGIQHFILKPVNLDALTRLLELP